MIKMDQIERIRKLVLVEGLSRRKAAKIEGVSRHAVRRALSSAEPPHYRLSKPRARPVLDKVQPLIAEMLRSDEGKPDKQKHTARRIYARLRDEYGYRGSEPSVRRCVAEMHHREPEVFVPLSFEPEPKPRSTSARRR